MASIDVRTELVGFSGRLRAGPQYASKPINENLDISVLNPVIPAVLYHDERNSRAVVVVPASLFSFTSSFVVY